MTAPTLKAAFADALLRRVGRSSFRAFVKAAWPLVCPEPLVWSWHLDELCALLEEVAHARKRDESREITVSIPPGMTKSLLVSVLWQAWVWTWWPESRWITCTYEQGLASDLSGTTLALVRSDWYQAAWPLELVHDAASRWTNVKGGERRAVGTGGAITGKHAHFHVGDDLIKEQDSRLGAVGSIAATMERASGFWFKTLSTRKVGQACAKVLVGQRLHVDDPPGQAVREHGYESVVFPMLYDEQIADPRDHRTTQGELLCEARCDMEGVREHERNLGTAGAAAQLGQAPVPPGGQLIHATYLDQRWTTLPSRVQRFLAGGSAEGIIFGLYGDMTFKGKVTSDFTVLQAWLRYYEDFFLLDQVRGQWGFREAKQRLKDFVNAWPQASYVKLEDAANAPAMQDDLVDEIPGLSLLPNDGCLSRQQRVEGPCWKAGLVHLPADAPWMGGSDGFVVEHLSYDGLGTRHDDQVATSGLALLDLSGGSAASWAAAWGPALQGAP